MTGVIESIGLWANMAVNFANNLISVADGLGAIGVDAICFLAVFLLVNWFIGLFKKSTNQKVK